MSEAFSRHVLRVAVAQICQSLGWNAVQTSPMELMTDVLERYLLELGKYTHRYCEQFGRTEPNLDDLGLAFQEMGISVPELKDYLKHVDPLPFACEVPQFPVPRENLLQFPNPGSRELLERKEYVDDYFPPMRQEWNDDIPRVKTPDTAPSLNRSTDSLTSPEKRPFVVPVDPASLKKTKSLPDEAGHSKYEMKGIKMSDHGHLTPTKQGKLPEARTPPPLSGAGDAIPHPPPPSSPLVSRGVVSETVEVRTNVILSDDEEAEIIDMAPGSPPPSPVVMKPKVKKTPKPTKQVNKSPKAPKKIALSPVLSSKPQSLKAKKGSDKKIKKSKKFVDDEAFSDEFEDLVSPGSPGASCEVAGRLALYNDSIDSVLEHSKELDRKKEEEMVRKRIEEEERKEREEKERERERAEKIERERIEQERLEQERIERERREREEKQRMLEERERREREERERAEEERLRRERHEREKQLEKERKELERQKTMSYDFDDEAALDFGPPSLPTPLQDSPSLSPILKEKRKKDKKEGKSSKHKLKITIGAPPETKEVKSIKSPEWPKVTLERLTPEDIQNFEYPSPPKQLPTIKEELEAGGEVVPLRLAPIRIGLGVGKDFKIKPLREDGSKEHKKKKKKKDKEKDRERRDKKDKKKKKERKDKDRKKDETLTVVPIPKLTFKLGGSKGPKVTMSHTSSENTSPSKNDEMVSPSRREILSPPSRLPSVHSPLHIPSSPSSPEPSPGPPLPYHALHHTPSTSPSPKRGRIDSVDSFTDLESDIKRKLSRSPVRHLSPPPPRTPSPATSSSSGPVSPGSPEAPLPTPLITQTVAAKAGKGPPASSGVFSETVGKIVDESGQITWICPTCKKADDGSPMIGCDNCDDWYHWFCVGITREPSDEQWYCVRCTRDLGLGKGRGGGRGRKYKRGGGRGGMAFKAKRGRKKVM